MDKTTAGILAGAAAAVVLAAVLLVGDEAGADRTDVHLSSTVRIHKVDLYKLADGGCAVQAYGTYLKTDGGVTDRPSVLREVAGANRTDCLNIMDTRAPALFRADEGL